MTTAEPTGPHPDVDRLADFVAGAGDGHSGVRAGDFPDAESVGRHLAGCPDCRATVATLHEADAAVLSRLAGVPTAEDLPADMPADIAERLDLALRPLRRADSAASLTVLPQERSPLSRRGARPGGRGGGWPAWFAGAAAVATVLALGIAIGVGALGGSSGSKGHGTAAASGTAANGAVTASNRNYTETSLGAALPALLAGHAGPPAAAAGSLASGKSATASAGPAGSTSAPLPANALASEQNLRTLAEPDQLRHCVANLTATPVAPQATPWLAVDLARWNGQPAAVILLPSPGKPAFVDAFVVAPGCPTGTFLYYHHYPRPAS